jgi:hypothetical protein
MEASKMRKVDGYDKAAAKCAIKDCGAQGEIRREEASRDRACNTQCYSSPNHFLITFIRSLIMQ